MPGKCYARCVSQDQFQYKEEQVIDKPASFRIEKIAAKYETVYDTVVVKAAYNKVVPVPAQFDVITEQQLVSPATKRWVKGKGDVNCLSQNPSDCEVWCLKEVPAVYKTVTRKVEKTPATTREELVPAITKVVPRKKLVSPASENKIEIPATYKTVMQKTLVKKGGLQEWKEVLCQQDVTDNKVKSIQMALIREGYDPGTPDNQMGPKTKEALVKFQQDKGLPVGNLNFETLKALGVE
ncbi:MAG: peptidoglycan-binding protein [Bacteroidetes bacterium]|nr:peptidoglycan-binding protein [Bacteroidota bacterium]